jgi:transcriptional regulator with XRE-family HTH domain
VKENTSFQVYLKSEFARRKIKSARYSLRMFAKDIGVAAPALSSYFNGHRNFSEKMMRKIFQKLAPAPDVMENILASYNNQDFDPDGEKLFLQTQYYHLISDPLYYSYLSLIDTKDFMDDDLVNSKRLNTKPEIINKIKNELTNLGLIKVKNKKIVPIEQVLASTDNIPNTSLRIRHMQNMEDAKSALINLPVNERYFAFETLSFDPEDLSLVQSKINQLMDDLIFLSKRGRKKTKVIEFCSLYFPRSN